jgi:tRNA dimethylallyltransferase
MGPRTGTRPLVVIVGETASGKSALALKLAEKFNGEIICADSRTVYKGMDIGTAKPSAQERSRVPHHLLDLVRPDEHFTVADFKRLALAAVQDISGQGKLPILVGGTGLYIDAILYDFELRPAADSAQREELNKLSIEQLRAKLKAAGIPLPRDPQNPRRLIRTLETGGTVAHRKPFRKNTLVIGLHLDKEALLQRITQRVGAMVKAGFVDEVKMLGERYGWQAPALQAPGYKAFEAYVRGDVSLEQAKNAFIKNDLDLAKRQRTWFKRNPRIQWFDDPSDAVDFVTTFLNKTLL